MSSSATLIRASLAGGILAALAFAAPASATPYSASWKLYQGCSQVTAGTGHLSSGQTCQADGQPVTPAPVGNEDAFTSTTSSNGAKVLDAAAFHIADTYGYTCATNCTSKTKTSTYSLTTQSSSSGGGGPKTSDKFQAALLGEYTGSSYGLGVENKTVPEHAVDNNNGDDLVVLKIPSYTGPGSLTLTLSPFSPADGPQDMSFTVYYGSINVNSALYADVGNTTAPDVTKFANATVNDLLSSGFTMHEFVDNGSCPAGSTTCTNAANLYQATVPQNATIAVNGTINYIIIAAGAQDLKSKIEELDYFKVNALTVRMPEPANLAVFAAGLVGMGMIARRRRKAA
jgi:hypothetical protein